MKYVIPNAVDTWYAVIPAIKDGSNTSYSNPPINNTSTPNIAPAIGVPKTAANPALTPQIINFFVSDLFNFNNFPSKLPEAAPTSAAGASLPAEPPPAIVSIGKKNAFNPDFHEIDSELCIDCITLSVVSTLSLGQRYFNNNAFNKYWIVI